MDLSLIPYALNLAAIYSLMAISISMIWSSIGMLNLAHGATFAVSGYAAWQFSIIFKPIILAFFGKTLLANLLMGLVLISSAMAAGAIFGILIYFLAYLPIHDKPNYPVRSLIITLAINIATIQILLFLFGARNKGLPKIFGFGRFEIFDIPVRYDQAGTIISTILILSIMLSWLKFSRMGIEIRAMMQNPEGASYSGISSRTTAIPVLMITGALAGVSAALLSQTIFVSPTSGSIPLIKGLTIALLGGLGNVPGAMLGAILIGFLEAVVGSIQQRYVMFSTFIFIIIVLIFRPRGIGGLLDDTRE